VIVVIGFNCISRHCCADSTNPLAQFAFWWYFVFCEFTQTEAVLGHAARGARVSGVAGDGSELDRPGAAEGAQDTDGAPPCGDGRSRGVFAGARHGRAAGSDAWERACDGGGGGRRSGLPEGTGADDRAVRPGRGGGGGGDGGGGAAAGVEAGEGGVAGRRTDGFGKLCGYGLCRARGSRRAT